MFYNEQQKMRYIKQSDMVEASKEVFERILSTALKVELQEKTDLANFNRKQVTNLLKTYNSRSRSYLRLVCNHFSKYYLWCYSEGLIDESNFTNWYDFKLVKPIIEEVLPNELLDNKFFDESYIKECVEKVKDKSNKLLLYAPYLGIDGVDHEDLRYLNIEFLHEERKAIQLHSGRVANVDDLFIKLIKDADKSIRYDKNGTGDNGRGRRTEYGASQYVFKMYADSPKDEIIGSKLINSRYAVIKDQTGNRLISPPLVYKNGLLNYIVKYFEPQGVSLYEALLLKKDSKESYKRKDPKYIYDEDVQRLINEFGCNMTTRMLRYQMTDIIQYWNISQY